MLFVPAGVVVALVFFFFVPFSEGTGAGAKLFFSTVMGAFAAYGLWCLWGIPSLVADLWNLARRPKRRPPSSVPVHHKGPPPELSASRQADVRRVVRVMAEQGVFAPETPDPALFYPGVAEMDESVKPDTILAALGELGYYHPGTDPARFMANLVMLDSKTEQDPGYLRGQAQDLARIADLPIAELTVDADWPPHDAPVPVHIAMQAGGSPLAIAYAGAVKYASSHIAHAIDARAGEVGTGRRLGWLWTDQGAWITGLPAGAVEAMNAAFKLKPQSRCVWEWIGDSQPFAAGDTP
ncbi:MULTISPECIES: hypothetical protein [unclassified Sphingopyxis]|uniref:hypothetical protein n=1 Tax=unclassified Sphingopyxis TaxID=2614943 RepID=UPI000736929D|nr:MULTISPECIES: hypothetical protein [unclassified Sphingopyxis]KTE31414.1 hypothetical protein ATE62_20040 [Sphingopyxis sp. HIX]KTE81451.1 hypothetical protein ATE72_16800 [Sphingopyxis sp. HXXIV]